MSLAAEVAPVPLRSPDRLFIGGQWVAPSSDAVIEVVDSASERPYLRVAEARPATWTARWPPRARRSKATVGRG